ncbi:MAG: DNA recombination protein RmuC, partial [Myxococcota bacterium]|nr:DNA recombination protein RmuC [Myxococcota bacterium]
LGKRIGESFRQVSERLEAVHQGLGEMQTLAAGVGDLKRVLANVKTRGTFGEIQLGALLEQVLAPGQYAANVAPVPGSAERVEYAIRLPGSDGRDGPPVWLPVDAKFPQEDAERLAAAQERGDATAAEQAARALETRLREEARRIRRKYVHPPATTDFALLFLPTESLYAEALRRPGLAERMQREERVVLAGPTTLGALLNSLQMGFRTLAIQERSGEVWRLLGVVKGQLGGLQEILGKVERRLEEAQGGLGAATRRTRHLERRLAGVETAVDAAPGAEEGPAPDGPA